MKKLLIAALTVVTATFFMGCGVAHPTVSGVVSKTGGKKVTAEASSINILMLTPMKVEVAEKAVNSLASQCGKDIVNITSHWRTTTFYIISFETLTVSGYCR